MTCAQSLIKFIGLQGPEPGPSGPCPGFWPLVVGQLPRAPAWTPPHPHLLWGPPLRPSLPMSPQDQAAKDKALQSMAPMSPAQAISATAFHSKMALARGPGHPAVSGVSGAAWSQRPCQPLLCHSSASLGARGTGQAWRAGGGKEGPRTKGPCQGMALLVLALASRGPCL